MVEHAELQAAALEDFGHEVKLIMGNDRPAVHPCAAPPGRAPRESASNVLPVGQSVIVPANGSLPSIVLSPRAYFRIRAVLERERFDVVHLQAMTPAICTAVLLLARTPVVATFHASGELGWMKAGEPLWGFLIDRIDHRIAVSERARASQERWLPGEYEVILTASSFRTRHPPAGETTGSCSPGGRSRGRAFRCSSARGQRSAGAPASA